MNQQILTSLQIGAVFRDSDHSCVGVSFSRNGSSLGVGFEDGTVQVINSETAEVTRTHRSHKYGLSHFSFLNQDKNGSLAVATASPAIVEDHSVRVWDLVQNRFSRVFKCHESSITNISAHPSKDILLSTSNDGMICMWDLRDERPVWQCREAKGSISTFDKAESSETATFAVTFPATKAIGIFESRKPQTLIKEIKCVSSSVDELVFTPDRERILVASRELGLVSTVNLDKEVVESTYFSPPTKTSYHLSVSPCSKYAMTSNPSSFAIDIWDLKTRVKVRALFGHESSSIAAFSPKHAMIATASLPVALWVPLNHRLP